MRQPTVVVVVVVVIVIAELDEVTHTAYVWVGGEVVAMEVIHDTVCNFLDGRVLVCGMLRLCVGRISLIC